VWVLVFTVPYHIGVGGLLFWRLQSLAARLKAEEEARSEEISKMYKPPSKPQS
jgi:hypothetical protein